MASTTIYTTEASWGPRSYNNSNPDLKVGKSSSDEYYGICYFPAIPSNWIITKMTLFLYRKDTYSGEDHWLQFGINTSNAFSQKDTFVIPSRNFMIPKGANYLDITDWANTIKSFGVPWYIHIQNGYVNNGTIKDSNSYSEFYDEKGTDSQKPRIVIEYSQGIVYYGVGGQWKPCLVYYGTGGQWKQVIPYYGVNGEWKQV